ncbi:GFA family protein [Tropicibacter oceani]|uniref:GFA family protein n=1 Tax=Tropicibacter oceani TaxID=3058420 RepID=A0ABY8QJ13_9RHOB|nr:GFA family protein [Tropicibacter oceani]WGW04006.1 GFA family protein [Tropicibacter oceani]
MNGSCACGSIRFTTSGTPEGASVCHCGQCRKMSGFAWSSAYLPQDRVSIEGQVRWVHLSNKAERGVCPSCGSFLFWRAHDEDTISFALGAIDGPTGLSLTKHIFTADKGDYYAIADGLPQRT